MSLCLMRTPYTAEDARLQNPELKVNLYSRQRLVSTLTIKTAVALTEALERIGRQKEEEALERIGAFFRAGQDEAPSSFHCLPFFSRLLSW